MQQQEQSFSTYHKCDLDSIRYVFETLEADFDPVLSVVQVTQMQHDDLITFLEELKKKNVFKTFISALKFFLLTSLYFY